MPARLPSVPDQRYLGVERLGLKGEVKPEDFVTLAKNQVPGKPNEPYILALGSVPIAVRRLNLPTLC
jgi:hypothetical protein